MSIFKRLLSVFTLGYILTFYSEIMFWSRWRPEDTILSFLITWIIYSIIAFFVLLMIRRFKTDNTLSVFLVGAVFGWIVEGIITQTVYENFPFQLVWTGLAWHALISVLLGLHFMIKALGRWSIMKAIAFFILLGVFWGIWASYWKLEDGYAISIDDFSLYAFSATAVLIIAYITLNLSRVDDFEPTKYEIVGFSSIIIYFLFYRVIKTPISLIILPLLLSISLYALKKLRGKRDILSNFSSIKLYRYPIILLIPLTATLVYALLRDLWLETNLIIAIATSSVGLYLFAKALYHAFKQ